MSAQPGQLKLEGSLSGPISSWALTAVKLSQALQSAGAPAQALQLHIEGGWLTLEPVQNEWALEQFSSAPPAEVLGSALQQLMQTVPPLCAEGEKVPMEWASTLRLTEFHHEHKLEVLFGLTDQGVQAVGRESPWRPVPPMSARDWLRRKWRLVLAVLVALVSAAYLQRDLIKAEWQKWNEPSAAETNDSGQSPSESSDRP
jgi:hypothetical protein